MCEYSDLFAPLISFKWSLRADGAHTCLRWQTEMTDGATWLRSGAKNASCLLAVAALAFNAAEEDERLCRGILSSIHFFHRSFVEDAPHPYQDNVLIWIVVVHANSTQVVPQLESWTTETLCSMSLMNGPHCWSEESVKSVSKSSPILQSLSRGANT